MGESLMKRFILVPAFLAWVVLPAAAAPGDAGLAGRLTWGPTADGAALDGLGAHRWLEQQLHPTDDDGLPPQVQARIAAHRSAGADHVCVQALGDRDPADVFRLLAPR